MDLSHIASRGLVLIGCGKMGSALLDGWLAHGMAPGSVSVIDPYPSDMLRALEADGLRLNAALPPEAAIVVLAVKPQMMDAALPGLKALGGGSTVFLSIAAGTRIAKIEEMLGSDTPVVRAMPNTPAAVKRGITALIGNSHASEAQMKLADALMQAVGKTVHLTSEAQMDAVTAISGSGPAYLFLMAEALTQAGMAEGLSEELATDLARATVFGAGALMDASKESAGQLRINVTSPAGTTAAALDVLMREEDGLSALIGEAAAAAANRSRELGG